MGFFDDMYHLVVDGGLEEKLDQAAAAVDKLTQSAEAGLDAAGQKVADVSDMVDGHIQSAEDKVTQVSGAVEGAVSKLPKIQG